MSNLYLKQLPLGPMQNFVYLIGDADTRHVVVVDPAWDIDRILQVVAEEDLTLDAALITQVLPTAAGRAKDLGVINIANSAPQVLGPALAAPIVASFGGYPALYLLTAAVTVVGRVLVVKIRSVR